MSRGSADPIYVEAGHPGSSEARAALEALGYEIVERSAIGAVQAIEIADGRAIGLADDRRSGSRV